MLNKQWYKQWPQVINEPWLSKNILRVVEILLSSYQRAFEEQLISSPKFIGSKSQQALELFTLQQPVLAHNTAEDPCLIYANTSALKLWDRCWEEMIGMPSRLTAPKHKLKERRDLLKKASENLSIKGYEGLRVDRKGGLFIIKNARIWSLVDEKGFHYGQAATFNNWEKI